MKRAVAVLLVLMLYLTQIPAVIAEETESPENVAALIDLSSMSLNELVELSSLIDTEIYSRIHVDNQDSISRGRYAVGTDIKAGQYEFVCTKAFMVPPAMSLGSIEVYQILDMDAFVENKLNLYGEAVKRLQDIDRLGPGDSAAFTLSEGMILVIDNCDGILKILDRSWTP